MYSVPSYDGAGLVNLVAELEGRLTGETPHVGLQTDLAALIPDADTYVFVLFDGLGVAQLAGPHAEPFARSMRGTLQAPFPTTTSVSLATIATGLPPAQHGLVSHLMWMESLGVVVNSLKWLKVTGEPVGYDYPSVLPRSNLWERLRSKGVEPVTVQPANFSGSPLSRLLYRGARFEGAWDVDDLVTATTQLAGSSKRLIFTYVPHVDYAGHVFGLASEEFIEAMRTAVGVWDGLAASLPPEVALIATADHGLLEFTEDQKLLIRDKRFGSLRFAGDTRGVQLWGDWDLMVELADMSGGALVDPGPLLGPNPTEVAMSRLGDKVLLPPDDVAVIPKGFDKRLRCYHGGLSSDEVEIPLLVA